MTRRFTVAVCGAAGGIGQPLSLLLAMNKDVKILNLYDVVPIVEGVAKDISHIDTDCLVQGFAGSVQDKTISDAALKKTLTGVDVVVIPAGVPRKPGMTRDDLFSVNAGIVRDLILAVAQYSPKAFVCIISNPVNSTVPIAVEVLKQKGVFDPKRVFGVSTLDVVRANKFVGEVINKDPSTVSVPVVGGHSGVSILPLLSQSTPKLNLNQEAIEKLTFRIQNAGTEVVEAKKGGGSATLSMAYAGARFAGNLMKALKGDRDVVECTYIYDASSKEYFAWPVKLGSEGVEKILKTEKLSAYEKKLFDKDVKQDVANGVKAGVEFVNSKL